MISGLERFGYADKHAPHTGFKQKIKTLSIVFFSIRFLYSAESLTTV